MKAKHTLVLSILCCVMVAAGCSEDGASTVTLNLTVSSFVPGEDPMPVAGAEVCVLDTNDCAMSDADGVATIGLPADAETGVTVTAAGFNPTLVPESTSGDFQADQSTSVLSEALAETLAALLDIDYPLDGTGVAVVNTTLPLPESGGMPGASYALTTGTGTGYYLGEGGLPSYELEATTAPLGSGGYVEVTPGTIEIDVGGSAVGCTPAAGWAGASASSIRLPVRDGFFTIGVTRCSAVRVTATVLGSEVPFGDAVPLEGAEVCLDGSENCATTNAEGRASLDVPGNEEFAYAVTAESDFFSLLSPQVSDTDIVVEPDFTLLSQGTIMSFAALIGTEWPPTTGVVSITLYEKPYPETVAIPGASFEIIEGTGQSYYLNDSNIPTTELSETQSSGTGGFVEVSVGTVEAGVTGVSGCDEYSNAWPGSAPNQVRFPSRVGYQTAVIWRCGE